MERKLTYIIVEDNILAQNQLKTLLELYTHLECNGIFISAIDALEMLKNSKPDLIFLDIEMPDMTGMDFLPLIDKSIKVIITSCSREYAVNSYLYNVVDYLNKPIFPDRIAKTIEKINMQSEIEKTYEKAKRNNLKTYILVKSILFDKKIYASDIVVCKSDKNEVIIVRDDMCEFKYKASLKKLSEELDPDEFVRINKSIIISLSKVKHLFKDKIELTDNNVYYISDEFSDIFNQKLIIFKNTRK